MATQLSEKARAFLQERRFGVLAACRREADCQEWYTGVHE
jgi:hypothetical protein